ncbi:MAG: hypothetical protein MUE83_17460, partial [Tabrizicola sp.]|nr:hypothetical protein [Tabrizicola sp.]
MAYKIIENRLGQTLIGSVDTSAAVDVGTIVRAVDPIYGAGEFIYLKGVASTVTGSWVTYNMDDGSTALLAANAIGPVAVAMGATVANTWGWYQIQGKAVGRVLAGFVDNANVYATATAGSVDDAPRRRTSPSSRSRVRSWTTASPRNDNGRGCNGPAFAPFSDKESEMNPNDPDLTLGVEFFMKPVENKAKSKEAGRPIFEDREMVRIAFPGDSKREHVAPAHEMHYVSHHRR